MKSFSNYAWIWFGNLFFPLGIEDLEPAKQITFQFNATLLLLSTYYHKLYLNCAQFERDVQVSRTVWIATRSNPNSSRLCICPLRRATIQNPNRSNNCFIKMVSNFNYLDIRERGCWSMWACDHRGLWKFATKRRESAHTCTCSTKLTV